MVLSDMTRFHLERDITETLLRLRLARSERDRKGVEEFEDRLNRLLERWGE